MNKKLRNISKWLVGCCYFKEILLQALVRKSNDKNMKKKISSSENLQIKYYKKKNTLKC